MTEIRCRPIDQWRGPRTPDNERRRGIYAIGWTRSLADFDRELDHLDANDPTLGIDLLPAEIRLDGWPRAHALPPPPVSFTCGSKYGPIRMQCDRFWDWHQNVRAICLTLQRLRLVDEGGCTRSGEQYVGFGALPAGGPTALGSGMTETAARETLQEAAGWDYPPVGDTEVQTAYRDAARALHPDHNGGDALRMADVNRARDVLTAAARG